MVIHAYGFSTLEAGGSQVLGQSGLSRQAMSSKPTQQLGMVAYAYNPRRSRNSRPAWLEEMLSLAAPPPAF